jgi:hypothetical protein
MWLTCEYIEWNKKIVSCAGQQSTLLALYTLGFDLGIFLNNPR